MKSIINSRRQFLLSATILAGAGGIHALAKTTNVLPDSVTSKPRLRLVSTASELGKGCRFNQYKVTGGPPSLVDGTIYISANTDNDKPLPLILYVYGSGQPASNFAIKNGVVRNDGFSLHHHFEELAGERARIMVVDNATVKFGDQSWTYKRGTLDAQRQFREIHTLPNWIDVLKSAIEAAWQEPWIDASKTLVCGHSDGASVVARLAEVMPGITHVAPLASGGLCHLLFFKLGTPAPFGVALDEALKEVQNIQSNPNSIDNFYAAFTYRFWSSGYLFMSDFESLAQTSARIFAAHGTADQNNSIQGFDFMCSGLKMLGKDIIIERIEGGDHSFHIAGEKEREGFRAVLSKVVNWFI